MQLVARSSGSEGPWDPPGTPATFQGLEAWQEVRSSDAISDRSPASWCRLSCLRHSLCGHPVGSMLAPGPRRSRTMPKFRTSTMSTPAASGCWCGVDFNVPMQNGEVTDATRIERACETPEELVRKGGKVVVLSHFGRPKGKVESSMSLKPIVKPLSCRLWAGSTCALRRTASASSPTRWWTPAGRRRGAARERASTPARRRAIPPSPTSSPRAGRLCQRRLLGLAPRPRLRHRPRRAAAPPMPAG